MSNAYPMSSSLVQRIGQALATLHQLQIPEALRQQSPEDNLLAAIDSHLLADLDAVAGITVREAEYLQRLRELIQPRQAYIRAFMARSRQYRDEIQQISLPTVVCHGDAWGGNIIPTASGQFVLLDWESSVVAPAERDAYNYIGFNGDNFAAFTTGYHSVRKEPFRWNSHRLAYYSYSHQLRNLATWLHNLLHEAYNAEQHAHDLEMIEYHCLNRLENVEHAVDRLVKTMKELPTSTFPLLQQDC